jgi:hypothetical protein
MTANRGNVKNCGVHTFYKHQARKEVMWMAKKYVFKVEHAIYVLAALFVMGYLSSFFKTAGVDLGRAEANKLFG